MPLARSACTFARTEQITVGDVFLFHYDLPQEKIAQRPPEVRGTSRMLVGMASDILQEESEDSWLIDSKIAALGDYLVSGDVLVLNNSKVLPCRFFAEKLDGGSEIEVLLIAPEPENNRFWQALARPMKRLRPGTELRLSAHLQARVVGRTGDEGERILLELHPVGSDVERSILRIIEHEGSMPIPGYIRDGVADEADKTRYQTIFSSEQGSIAAPTAGLHLTESLLETLQAKGIHVAFVTLHVGVASFSPVRDVHSHKMPCEWYRVPLSTAETIQQAKTEGRKILAVGTTTVRTLESSYLQGNFARSEELVPTELFITPGFEFRMVDAMLTNFHQPQTTHLLLVSAFFGEDKIRRMYDHALAGDYRFLSYGDCMLLLPNGV